MSFSLQLAKHAGSADFAKAAMDRAMELGVPSKKNENWKYTNLEKHLPEWDLAAQDAVEFQAPGLPEGFHHLVFINGALDKAQSSLPIQGPEFANLDGLGAVKDRLANLLSDEFTFQLSESNDKRQYLLELDSPVELPIMISSFYSDKLAKHASFHLHVHLKSGAQADFIDVQQSLGQSQNFVNNTCSFLLEPNSRAKYVKTQLLNNESSCAQNIRALVARDASFDSITVDIGAKLSRNNVHIVLEAPGAEGSAHGLAAISGEQQSDTSSFIHHASERTSSAQLHKNLLGDKARGIFNGVIRMERDAQLCESEQLNQNLLLSKGAHALSRPQLEVFADDVKAAHGSTTGQLSEEELFYFQSRGVSKERAQKLLAQAFLNDVLLKVKNPKARALAQELVAQRLSAKTPE